MDVKILRVIVFFDATKRGILILIVGQLVVVALDRSGKTIVYVADLVAVLWLDVRGCRLSS